MERYKKKFKESSIKKLKGFKPGLYLILDNSYEDDFPTPSIAKFKTFDELALSFGPLFLATDEDDELIEGKAADYREFIYRSTGNYNIRCYLISTGNTLYQLV